LVSPADIIWRMCSAVVQKDAKPDEKCTLFCKIDQYLFVGYHKTSNIMQYQTCMYMNSPVCYFEKRKNIFFNLLILMESHSIIWEINQILKSKNKMNHIVLLVLWQIAIFGLATKKMNAVLKKKIFLKLIIVLTITY